MKSLSSIETCENYQSTQNVSTTRRLSVSLTNSKTLTNINNQITRNSVVSTGPSSAHLHQGASWPPSPVQGQQKITKMSEIPLTSSRTALSPEIQKFLHDNNSLHLGGEGDFHAERRHHLEVFGIHAIPKEKIHSIGKVEFTALRGPHGTIPIRIFYPADGAKAALIYFHGGGYTVGSVDEFENVSWSVSLRKAGELMEHLQTGPTTACGIERCPSLCRRLPPGAGVQISNPARRILSGD